MKYSSILIIVFGMLCGCVRQKKADSSGTESIETPQSKTDTSVGVITDSDSLQGAKNAIYYWKTVFGLTGNFYKSTTSGKSICGCLM